MEAKAFLPKTYDFRGRPLVIVEDAIGRLKFRVPGPNPSHIRDMTCEHLFASFMARVRNDLIRTSTEVYVILLDDRTRVTCMKKAERDRRIAASEAAMERKHGKKLMPYKPDSLLTDGGIDEKRGHGVKPLNMDRVVASPGLWDKLMELFASWLARKSTDPNFIPRGKKVILDYFSTGPREYPSAPETATLGYLAHPFGEADLMCAVWCHFYRKSNYSVLVMSEDSDVMLILLNYMHNATGGAAFVSAALPVAPGSIAREAAAARDIPDGIARGGIYLKRNLESLMDFVALARGIGDRLIALNAASIATGSDLHQKKTLINRIGNKEMIEWAMQCGSGVTFPETAEIRLKLNLYERTAVSEPWARMPLFNADMFSPRPIAAVVGLKRVRVTIASAADAAAARSDTATVDVWIALLCTRMAKFYYSRKGRIDPEAVKSDFTSVGGRTLAFNMLYWWPNWQSIEAEVKLNPVK